MSTPRLYVPLALSPGTRGVGRALTRRPLEGGGGRMSPAGLLRVATVALSLTESACLVQITHVADPGPLFHDARAEAQRLAGRPGPAHELNVLVWSPDDRQLVRVSLPMWIVRKAEKRIDWDDAGLDGERSTR